MLELFEEDDCLSRDTPTYNLNTVYLFMVCVVLIVSLSKKVHHSEGTYQILCGIFGVLIVAFLIFGMFHVYENEASMQFLARSFLIAWMVSYFVPLFY